MLEILHNYLPLFLIGAHPDGPLGGLAMTLILSVLGLGLSFPIAILIGWRCCLRSRGCASRRNGGPV